MRNIITLYFLLFGLFRSILANYTLEYRNIIAKYIQFTEYNIRVNETQISEQVHTGSENKTSILLTIHDVPLVYEGIILMECKYIDILQSGVLEFDNNSIQGLNCTSKNSLVKYNDDVDITNMNTYGQFENNELNLNELYNSSNNNINGNDHFHNVRDIFKVNDIYIDDNLENTNDEIKEYENKDIIKSSYNLEIIFPIQNDLTDNMDFCRISLNNILNKDVIYFKLMNYHYSLIKLGIGICIIFNKFENIFFNHPSPITEYLEGDLDIYEQNKQDSQNNTEDIVNNFSFNNNNNNNILNIKDNFIKSKYESYNLRNKADYFNITDEISLLSTNLKLKPYIRISYIPYKPYPKLFFKSNIPTEKAIGGMNRSNKKNYYLGMGMWQQNIVPGFTRINELTSILSLHGHYIYSNISINYFLYKYNSIIKSWRSIIFTPDSLDYNCNIGKSSLLRLYSDTYQVNDSTNIRTPKDIFNVNLDDLSRNIGYPCNIGGSIRKCLKKIRSYIYKGKISHRIGNRYINYIYDVWIAWEREIWHIKYAEETTQILKNLQWKNKVNNLFNKQNTPKSHYENEIWAILTRLLAIEPMKNDTTIDILSLLKSNNIPKDQFNNTSQTFSLAKDIFQYGVFSINILHLPTFWEYIYSITCKVAADSLFITWIMNKFTYNTKYNNQYIVPEIPVINNNLKDLETKSEEKNSWLLLPLPIYNISKDIDVEFENDKYSYDLPLVYDFDELNNIFITNSKFSPYENSIRRKKFFRSNYFDPKYKKKWYSFIVRNVPYRNNSRGNLEFKCNKGSWPYKYGTITWLSQYLCETVFIKSEYLLYKYKFDTYDNNTLLYNSENSQLQNSSDNIEFINEFNSRKPSYPSHIIRSRMIGIEFETENPHRCGIGYLGDELEKTLTNVKGSILLHIALGFCTYHGFELQWLSDNSFDIHTNILFKYTQSLEYSMTYYERIGFELNGHTQLRVFANYTCATIGYKNNYIFDDIYLQNSDLKLKIEDKKSTFDNLDINYYKYLNTCQLYYEPLVVSNGIRIDELHNMRNYFINSLYNLRFECNLSGNKYDEILSHCSQFYPLLSYNKELNKCNFEMTSEWKYLNEMFSDKCYKGGRIGKCHEYLRKMLICDDYNEYNCKLDIFIVDNFIKPKDINLVLDHLHRISFLLMNGIKLSTKNWNLQHIQILENLFANLINKEELDLFYNHGIYGFIKSRLDLFRSEFNKYSNIPLMADINDIFTLSGISIDVHSLPILWKLATYRLEEIPNLINIDTDNIKSNSKLKILKPNIKSYNNLTNFNNILTYCPQALGYLWIDKYMWQMYRLSGSNKHNIKPI
ncbi:uncharacterized protein CMU_031840 [Cryptosporidium muris RN66]|uniref:Uncharacterized protein n=1 Tax=Cryptosporidium muris (strain RN66) TaxID=441375 RepID=B6AIK2_CRYMR|nr:uncharacterized protein CMU_031840 [Cryptosporidium muris RN66]EEA08043.1 hypothetical protein, conserved [Cryptosporidium muris RN66]|eukprot:XP_002142392.1 hypothetical protein [Cryptosporidium muris RN66]